MKVLALPAISISFIKDACNYILQSAPQVQIVTVALRRDRYPPEWRLSRSMLVDQRTLEALQKMKGIHLVVEVDPAMALEEARRLARTKAILSDLESAAAVAVARQLNVGGVDNDDRERTVVVICTSGL